MASFEWGDGTVHAKPATGRTRTYYFYLKTTLGVYDMPDGFERESYDQMLYLLARTETVEGDIGFDVPLHNPTEEALREFCDALLDAPEMLFLKWNSAVFNAKAGQNDPALLPPDDVPDSKKKNTLKKDDSNA